MPPNILHWLGWYFAIPLALGIAIKCYTYFVLKNREKYSSSKELLFSLGAVLLTTLLWPLVIPAILLDRMFGNTGLSASTSKAKLYCQRKHLLSSISIAEAESKGKVIDPLRRAPDLPFGHLNPAWQTFLKKQRFWYRLKAFTIPGEPARKDGPQWSMPRGRKLGYAWVGLWRVKAEFLTEWDS